MYEEYTYVYVILVSQDTSFLDGCCSTVQGLLDWFEVDLGFTELSFILHVCICQPRISRHILRSGSVAPGTNLFFSYSCMKNTRMCMSHTYTKTDLEIRGGSP